MDMKTPAALSDEQLESSRRAFVEALVRGDAASASQAYATDGRLLLPSTAPLDGRQSIEAFWRAGLDAGLSGLELTPQSIYVDTTFASEVGAYMLESTPRGEAPMTERGRYLVVHRLHPGGRWLRALEVYAPEVRPD